MSKPGKRYRGDIQKVKAEQRYTLTEALKTLDSFLRTKFDETVEVALRLGIDPKQSDQMVRGACTLPHGIGKKIRVAVFAKGEKVKEAEQAGADAVGGDDLVEKIKGGWLEFDAAIATPDMMGLVGKIGKILGPRGLMPNPKLGSVTFEVARAVQDAKAGKVEFRVEKAGIVQAPVGKRSFGPEKLNENILALLEAILKAKPASAKGNYFKSMSISGTMTPGVRIDVNTLLKA